MSNALPLLLGGGILAFFLMNKKKSTTSSNSNESITSKIGSKEIGYEIINCNKVIIYDEQKAYAYAFTMGVAQGTKNLGMDEWNTSEFEELLVGDCLEKIEQFKVKEQAFKEAKKFFYNKTVVKFIYNLFRYLYSGYVTVYQKEYIEEDFIKNLNKMKSSFKEMGFDTTDLQTVLIEDIKIGK